MGLLSGIGQVLAGGAAGGAKAAGESFVEQAKQQALAAREENMLRIQALSAKEGREETQKFTKAQDTANFERGITQRKVEAEITETKEAARHAERKEKEQLEYDRRVALEEKVHGRRKGEDEVTYQRRRLEAGKDTEDMLTFKNNLPDKTKSAVEKNYDGLIRMKVPPKEALALSLSSQTKEESAEERALLLTWRTVFSENTRGGADSVAAAKTATTVTGVDPVALWSRIQARQGREEIPTKPAGEFDLQSFLKTLNPSGSQATKTAVLPEKGGGIIENQMKTTPSPESPDPGFFQREYDERMKREREEKYEANLPVRPSGTSTLGRR